MLTENLYETKEIEKLKTALDQNRSICKISPKKELPDPWLLLDQHSYLYLDDDGQICLSPTANGKIYPHIEIETELDDLCVDYFPKYYGVHLKSLCQFKITASENSGYFIEIFQGYASLSVTTNADTPKDQTIGIGDLIFVPTNQPFAITAQSDCFFKISHLNLEHDPIYRVRENLLANYTEDGRVMLSLGEKKTTAPAHIADAVYWVITEKNIHLSDLKQKFPEIDHEKFLHDLLRMKILI